MAEKTEFLTILNLFKSDENSTIDIANVLLKTRLEKINSLTFDQYFMRDLIGYLQKSDHVPDRIHADIYNILTNIIVEDKAAIRNVVNEANSLSSNVTVLKNKCSQLEKEQDIMSLKYFLQYNVEKVESDAFITLDELLTAYNKWSYKVYYNGEKEFKKLVQTIWTGPADDDKWFGLRFNYEHDKKKIISLEEEVNVLKKEKDVIHLTHFVKDNIKLNANTGSYITLDEIFEAYNKWSYKQFTSDKQEFKKILGTVWMVSDKDGIWSGFRLEGLKRDYERTYSNFIQNNIYEVRRPHDNQLDTNYAVSVDHLFDACCKSKEYCYVESHLEDKKHFKTLVEEIWLQKSIDNIWIGLKLKTEEIDIGKYLEDQEDTLFKTFVEDNIVEINNSYIISVDRLIIAYCDWSKYRGFSCGSPDRHSFIKKFNQILLVEAKMHHDMFGWSGFKLRTCPF